MQVLKLTWVPSGQVFAQPKTFEEAIAAATTKALRAGFRDLGLMMGADGDTFRLCREWDELDILVSCEYGDRIHHLAGVAKTKEPARQRTFLQNIQGKPPSNGWYKGLGRRFDLAADPRKGPYFLVAVDADDRVIQPIQHIEPLVQKAGQAGAEYPLDVVLTSNDVTTWLEAARLECSATFAVVLRDDAPPKLRLKDKWDGLARSMQVVYRRPL